MLHTAVSDPELVTIERARAGDGHAFSRLVETYQAPIFNLCYRILSNPHDAEEAAQEAFLRAYTRLGSFDPARPFKTWLFSIAHHYCIDRLRRRRLRFLSLDDEPALDTAAWRSSAPTPEETAVRREREDDIQALLDTLPLPDRSTRGDALLVRSILRGNRQDHRRHRQLGQEPFAPCTGGAGGDGRRNRASAAAPGSPAPPPRRRP